MASDRVWFITGGSTGFGRALAQKVRAKGERAVAMAGGPGYVGVPLAGPPVTLPYLDHIRHAHAEPTGDAPGTAPLDQLIRTSDQGRSPTNHASSSRRKSPPDDSSGRKAALVRRRRPVSACRRAPGPYGPWPAAKSCRLRPAALGSLRLRPSCRTVGGMSGVGTHGPAA